MKKEKNNIKFLIVLMVGLLSILALSYAGCVRQYEQSNEEILEEIIDDELMIDTGKIIDKCLLHNLCVQMQFDGSLYEDDGDTYCVKVNAYFMETHKIIMNKEALSVVFPECLGGQNE